MRNDLVAVDGWCVGNISISYALKATDKAARVRTPVDYSDCSVDVYYESRTTAPVITIGGGTGHVNVQALSPDYGSPRAEANLQYTLGCPLVTSGGAETYDYAYWGAGSQGSYSGATPCSEAGHGAAWEHYEWGYLWRTHVSAGGAAQAVPQCAAGWDFQRPGYPGSYQSGTLDPYCFWTPTESSWVDGPVIRLDLGTLGAGQVLSAPVNE